MTPDESPGGWLELSPDDPFGLHNLPYGLAMLQHHPDPRVVIRVGDRVLDVASVTAELLPEAAPLFADGRLEPLMTAGPVTWRRVRDTVTMWLTSPVFQGRVESALTPLDRAAMVMPFTVADYVDFYASEHHASNIGRIFRPDSDPLTPNWKHLPIGYHGRAGTVVVSGTSVIRPSGQTRDPDGSIRFGPSSRLDIEAELGFVVGVPSKLGTPVPLSRFPDHVFGVCLLNDWSARDIQAWEYVPLGPFLGKSFATSISPWLVTLDALEPARVRPPLRDPRPLAYLDDTDAPVWGLDIALTVKLNGQVISEPPFATMYWTPAQQLAHMTVNGASLRTGDLYGSGTISGPRTEQRGSLIELTWNGQQPLRLSDGTTRRFLDDGDEVVIAATAPSAYGGAVGFGEVRGTVLAAAGPPGG
jgi:fumarylacetoacetase